MNIFDFMTPEELAFFAVLVGTLTRTVLPYLQKHRDDPTIVFSPSYIVTFAIALVESLIVSLLSFVSLPPDILAAQITPLAMFAAAFAWAYMSNDLFNRVITSGTTSTPAKT